MNDKRNQCQRIIVYLREHQSITQAEAWVECGVMRLASRIHDLRMQGFDIDSDFLEVRNKYGETCRVKRYFLKKP